MKISYISTAFLTDCDLPLINELQQLGVEVDYFLMTSDINRQRTLINIDKLHQSSGIFPAASYPSLSYLAQYTDISHVWIANMPVAHDYALSSLATGWKLYSRLRKGNYDLIHLTGPVQYSYFPLYLLKTPMVMTMHDPLPHSSDDNRMVHLHRKVAFHRVHHFILLNKVQKDAFINRYSLSKAKVYDSRLSIYTHLLHTPSPERIVDSKYILYVGSINPHKGIEYACKAIRKTREKHPDVKLVVAGKGSFNFDIEPYVNDGCVELKNRFVTNEELISLISHSEFVVCPYIDATQSGVVMSAFALNKPVVATQVGALHEMITHNRHGLLVPPKDEVSLSDAFNSLLDTPQTLESFSENIMEDYSYGKLSWKTIASDTINTYNDVILIHQ